MAYDDEYGYDTADLLYCDECGGIVKDNKCTMCGLGGLG